MYQAEAPKVQSAPVDFERIEIMEVTINFRANSVNIWWQGLDEEGERLFTMQTSKPHNKLSARFKKAAIGLEAEAKRLLLDLGTVVDLDQKSKEEAKDE